MAQLLKGAPVAAAINETTREMVQRCIEDGIVPAFAIIRVGERPDDLSYETGAKKRADSVGIRVISYAMPADVDQETMEDLITSVNEDPNIHGVLLLRPLPKSLNEVKLVSMLTPAKDVDGITDSSLAGVFTGQPVGYPPCTADACIRILKHYEVPIRGKRAVVMGRSLVIGRPVSMMLMAENATVTICHTKTEDPREETRRADIVVAAAGQKQAFDPSYFTPGQVVVDVGIHFNDEGKMCGDVQTLAVSELVDAITPVPGGVGAVTTAVLMSHVADAAAKCCKEEAH